MNYETYTISQFCEAHNLSRAFFYNLKKQGLAPKIVELGGKRLVTREAAEAWRAELATTSDTGRAAK